MRSLLRAFILVATCQIALIVSGCAEPEIGVTDEEIKIGTWAPLSGPIDHFGAIALSMEAYFQHVNRRGGVHGRMLKLIIKDDGNDPSRTPEVVRELVEQDEVFAIVGGVGTTNCLAVKEYLTTKSVPWINPGSGSRLWTTPTQATIFSILPTHVTEGRILSRYAVEELEAEKIGLFYQDDAFGHEGQEGVRLGLRNVDKKPEVSLGYQVGALDLSIEARKFKKARVDTVLLWATPEAAAALMKEFEKLGFRPRILASEVLADPVMFELCGKAWEGAIVSSGVLDPDSDEPEVGRARKILAEFEPDVPFGTIALMGMSWSDLLVEGLIRAGSRPTRARLIHELERMEDWSDHFLGKPISFSPESHQGLDAVRLMKAEGGKYVYLTDWLDS